MDHVDVDNQVEALWLDPSPVLMGQRNIQVDGRLHIVHWVASSVRFYTGKSLSVILGGLPDYIPQGLSEVYNMLPGTRGDLQSLQRFPGVHALSEHRQDVPLVPVRGGGAQHRAQPQV